LISTIGLRLLAADGLRPSHYGFLSALTDLLARIESVIDGRALLSLREQLLADCYEQIKSLQERRIADLEKAAKIVEEFEVDGKTIVGKIRIADRKKQIAAQIRELK
jgi:hypothetical protein